jgi:hypothetical protein
VYELKTEIKGKDMLTTCMRAFYVPFGGVIGDGSDDFCNWPSSGSEFGLFDLWGISFRGLDYLLACNQCVHQRIQHRYFNKSQDVRDLGLCDGGVTQRHHEIAGQYDKATSTRFNITLKSHDCLSLGDEHRTTLFGVLRSTYTTKGLQVILQFKLMVHHQNQILTSY